jgi:hypothetical protein
MSDPQLPAKDVPKDSKLAIVGSFIVLVTLIAWPIVFLVKHVNIGSGVLKGLGACVVLLGLLFVAVWNGWRPSRWLKASMRRESNPTPAEEASMFYRRGVKYNAFGGLQGTHALALAWQLVVILPLWTITAITEAIVDALQKKDSAA